MIWLVRLPDAAPRSTRCSATGWRPCPPSRDVRPRHDRRADRHLRPDAAPAPRAGTPALALGGDVRPARVVPAPEAMPGVGDDRQRYRAHAEERPQPPVLLATSPRVVRDADDRADDSEVEQRWRGSRSRRDRSRGGGWEHGSGRIAAPRSADDVVLHRPQRGGGAGRDADLVVDVLDVVIGGLGRDEEPVGDLARREPPAPRAAARRPRAATARPDCCGRLPRRRFAARRARRPRAPRGSRAARARPLTRAGAARRPRRRARTPGGRRARWSSPRRSPSRPARTPPRSSASAGTRLW